MSEPARVAIVGGGISGLSAAYFLERDAAARGQSVQIDLFEAASRLGGKIQSIRQDDLLLELGAESFLSRKTPAVDLCREVGIDKQLRGTRAENRKTFVWHDDRLHPLPKGLSGFVPGNMNSLFSTSLLNLRGKLRVAADYVIPASRRSEDESLAHFMTRRLGKQAYQRLVQPLLCGIYAADGEQLSLQATYPELRKLEQASGSLIRGLKLRQQRAQQAGGKPLPPFVTLPNGMSDLIEAVAGKLVTTKIHLNAGVKDCQQHNRGWAVRLNADADAHVASHYDALLMSCPAYKTSQLLSKALPAVADPLNEIPHVSTATVNLWYAAKSFSHPLDGYGFVIPSHEQRGLTAVTWTSSKHHDRAPDDWRLIRGYVGRAGAEIDDEMSDEEMVAIVLRELKRTMGIHEKPVGTRIQRWLKGSPQYTLGHCDKLQKIDEALAEQPGLFLCGASYRGVGIPDCIREAGNAIEAVFHYLEGKT
ncbi:MAG: protoporphyrinogen oxidase [Pirellulaceae bacterium]|nr:protoporphyrinogen oxidase [Pirellulaceae bacterium]